MIRLVKPITRLRLLPCFSSDQQIYVARAKLRQSVLSEFKFEYQNYQPPQEFKTVLRKLNYELVDLPDSMKIELRRPINNGLVRIVFAATKPQMKIDKPKDKQDFFEQDDLDHIKEQVRENQEDAVDPVLFSVDFTVYVQTSTGETIAYECNSADHKININYVTFIYDIEHHMSMSKIDRLLNQYNGPIYNSLDQRLKAGLLDYMTSLGLTDAMSQLIEQLALDKEQRLYMEFLKRMDKFLL